MKVSFRRCHVSVPQFHLQHLQRIWGPNVLEVGQALDGVAVPQNMGSNLQVRPFVVGREHTLDGRRLQRLPPASYKNGDGAGRAGSHVPSAFHMDVPVNRAQQPHGKEDGSALLPFARDLNGHTFLWN